MDHPNSVISITQEFIIFQKYFTDSKW